MIGGGGGVVPGRGPTPCEKRSSPAASPLGSCRWGGGSPPGFTSPATPRGGGPARQVADLLRRQIIHGSFPHGQLPLEAVLAREFDISRNTVREALDLLREEGLVERSPGVGTTVVAEKYPQGLHRLLGLAETLHE